MENNPEGTVLATLQNLTIIGAQLMTHPNRPHTHPT